MEEKTDDLYQKGYSAGYDTGYDKGYESGYDDGYEKGSDEGYNEAVEDIEYDKQLAKEEYEKKIIPDLDDIVAAIKGKDYEYLLLVINRIRNNYTMSDLV